MGKNNVRSGGKLLDTWHYEYKGIADTVNRYDEPVQTVAGKKVAIELRLIKGFEENDAPPMAVKEVNFRLVCKEANIHLSGTDIEVLRKVMWGQLDTRFAVKWKDYFLVRIEEMEHYFFHDGARGSGLQFSYSRVEKGTAWDGTLLIRKEKYMQGEWIDLWPGEFKDKGGKVMACIPDTPENKAALEEFSLRVDNLRLRLADLLRPKNIMNTLTNLSSIAMLPPPPDPED